MGERKRQLIDFFWNGNEGILPWFCFFDDNKKIIYPLITSQASPTIFTFSPPTGSNWINILQIEDIAQNVIYLVAKENGFGNLYDANGNSYGNWDVKRFVIIRNQWDAYPFILVLRKEGSNYKLYGGVISNPSSPFSDISPLTGINEGDNLSFFDIAKFQNRVLFLQINEKGLVALWWSKTEVQWSQKSYLHFWTPPSTLNPYMFITFPEYFIILPPSNFHFIWENFLVMSDGLYNLYPTEISGTFSLIYEKIYPISIPNEFGGGTGFNDIRAGFQYFKNGFAVSLRGNTYVIDTKGKFSVIEQTGVDTYISPNAPLNIRRLGFKHSVSPYLAYPENWRFFKNDNFIVFSEFISSPRQLKVYIFQLSEKGYKIPNRAYIITNAGDPYNIKYLRRIAPIRFYEIYIQTNANVSNFNPPEPPFILDNLIITEHSNYTAEQKWIQTRDAGNTFIIDFEVPQTIQALFEFEFDTGR